MPVLTTTGKNLFDGEIEEGVFDSNGNPSNYVGRTRSKNFIKVPKNTDLYISIGGANNNSWTNIYFYNDLTQKIRDALDGDYFESFYQKYRQILGERLDD